MAFKYYQVPDLKDHFVSEKYGFVLENNLETLSGYFEPWNTLAKRMPEFVQTKQFHRKVHEMSLLDVTRLVDEAEWILAHVQLSVIAAGYVWQNGKTNPAKVLPKQVAVPLWKVSQHLNIQPLYVYLDLALANVVPIDKYKAMKLGNMRALYLMPGGSQCEWFFTVLAQLEIDAVEGIKAMVEGKKAILGKDKPRLIKALDQLRVAVGVMETTLKRINEKLDPDVFKNVIRPFLLGYGPGTPLPEGLIFEGVSTIPKQYAGSSSAQSSTFAFLDAGLNITNTEEQASYLAKMQFYMHPAHLRFIIIMTDGPSIRNYVTESRDADLTAKFAACIQQMKNFKSTHYHLIAKFVD